MSVPVLSKQRLEIRKDEYGEDEPAKVYDFYWGEIHAGLLVSTGSDGLWTLEVLAKDTGKGADFGYIRGKGLWIPGLERIADEGKGNFGDKIEKISEVFCELEQYVAPQEVMRAITQGIEAEAGVIN